MGRPAAVRRARARALRRRGRRDHQQPDGADRADQGARGAQAAARWCTSTPTAPTSAAASRSGCAGWAKNGWQTSAKQPVKNVDLWQELVAAVRAARRRVALGQGPRRRRGQRARRPAGRARAHRGGRGGRGMSRALLVAAGQAASVSGDLAANVATAARLTGLAATQGVRLLVLPEAFLTGYDVAAFDGPLPDADDLDGPGSTRSARPRPAGSPSWRAPRCAAAMPGGCRRSSSGPDGTATAPYDKQHLDGLEKQLFTTGDHGASIMVEGVELGLSICYDGCFPEHAQAAARDGAVGLPAARRRTSPAARTAATSTTPRGRVENGMYVVLLRAHRPVRRLRVHRRLGGLRPRGPAARPARRRGGAGDRRDRHRRGRRRPGRRTR